MGRLMQDLRYAIRTFRKQPGFTITAIATLALGIGANAAIFTVVDSTLLRPLPFPDYERLMEVSLTLPRTSGAAWNVSEDMDWSYPKFETFRQSQRVFDRVAVYASKDFTLTGGGDAEMVTGETVSAEYLSLLGITAELGRTFVEREDAAPESARVAILGHSLWERRFGRDPGVIGRAVTLDTEKYIVVGVLPAGFRGLTSTAELWVPTMAIPPDALRQRWDHWLQMIARLKPGATPEEAKSAVRVLGRQVDEAHPSPIPGDPWGAKARSMSEARVDPAIRKSVWILQGAVGFVLLIACANIANLLLARGNARSREIAMRLAVGASRGRLVRQLLTESMLLAVAGAALGLVLAWYGVGFLDGIFDMKGNWIGRHVSGLTLLGLRSIRVDTAVLGFTAGIAVLTGLLFGLIPALQSSGTPVWGALRDGGQRGNSSRGYRGLSVKSGLVVAEVAVALVLLVTSGLMIQSLWRLVTTKSGMDLENVLTLRVNRNLPLDNDPDSAAAYFQQLEARLAAVPGVLSVGLDDCAPLSGGCRRKSIYLRDRPPAAKGTEPVAGIHFASPNYLRTMRIPLVSGRWFSPADRAGMPKVVVINESAAKKFWPRENPIGKPIGIGAPGFMGGAEIVGIVGDVRYRALDQAAQPEVYVPYLQAPSDRLLLFVRTSGAPNAFLPAVRQAIHEFDHELPAYDIQSMSERISGSTTIARNSALLLGIFALLALILAMIGIYGVMSFVVGSRTREIGIRIALGCGRTAIVGMIMRRALLWTGSGVLIGVIVSMAAARLLRSLLYQVTPDDPATYIVLACVLGIVALGAGMIPAWRASRLDPLLVIRGE